MPDDRSPAQAAPPLSRRLLLAGAAALTLCPWAHAEDDAAEGQEAPERPAGRAPPVPPAGAAPYVPQLSARAGSGLVRARQTLSSPADPARPFVIWALGSSYTNGLGFGRHALEALRARWPQAPPLVWRQTIGNAVPWQFLRGWAEGEVIPANPDVVLIYTIGKPRDLEDLLLQLRARTSAELIVPTVHWRQSDAALWGSSEDAPDQKVAELRELCATHGAELLEHRAEWARYLRENNLGLDALLRDKVHQSPYGAWMLQALLAATLSMPPAGVAEPKLEVSAIDRVLHPGETLELRATGGRFDLGLAPGEGRLAVKVDGKAADAHPCFVQGPVVRGANNAAQVGVPARDVGPHGLRLATADRLSDQRWTLRMTDDTGGYAIEGSRSGPQGQGRNTADLSSADGQVTVPAGWWRRPGFNRTGDTYTIDVQRGVVSEVDAVVDRSRPRHSPRYLEHRLAIGLEPGPHRIELRALGAPVTLRKLYASRVQA